MKAALRIGVFAAVGLTAFGMYRWWNSPERQIRRVLDGIAEGLSHDKPAQGIGAIAGVASLQQYFAEDVVVDAGRPFGVLTGRQHVVSAAAQLYAATERLDLDFVDVDISVVFGGSAATVTCSATATFVDRAGRETVDARELEMRLGLNGGRWVIRGVKAVEVLQR